ncbi:hypothetical protein FRC08_017534 [Ceratobasidium sp. 394]|nr:hypothetical protein FRC08_017534 [Ceratobasidium sp. 394]
MVSECDARLTAEASVNGDAASRGDEVAESVPSINATPETQRCGTVIPETDDENNIFVTARTSRVRSRSLSNASSTIVNNKIENAQSEPETLRVRRRSRLEKRPRAKSVSDISPSPRRSVNRRTSWADELARAEGERDGSDGLPEVDQAWVNPDWSRSAYESVSVRSEQADGSEKESVAINAVVYELDSDFVISDSEYANILRNLREQARERGTPSQTSGAGPSGRRTNPRVTVEEVEDEDNVRSHQSLGSASEGSVTPSGKGKGKHKNKKKKKTKRTKAPELGIDLDNLK